MSFVNSFLSARPVASMGRMAEWRRVRIGVIAALHLVALAIMLRTEGGWTALSLFVLGWGVLNFLFLLALPRPGISAALSLLFVVVLVVVSQLKFTILWMVINFFDVLIIDSDTIAFLLTIFPDVRLAIVIAAVLLIPCLWLIWRIDPFYVPRLVSLAGTAACSALLIVLSLAVPEEPWEQFQGVNHLSTFMRSGVTTAYELSTRGWIDFDTATSDQLAAAADQPCHTNGRPPHIIMVLDEAGFDITAAPGVKVPPGYDSHFKSFDGRQRAMLVEGSGGPTWYTEYNVLTGLSARSYGRLSYYVTRIAAGRVKRGLPQALARCGYKTVTLYPAYGSFLSARNFQKTTGVERFLDSSDMKAKDLEPDRFFYDQALQVIHGDTSGQPLFIFVYTVFNHFPWWKTVRPELTPDWKGLGNHAEVDEYIRRQTLSARDYRDFRQKLQHDFPSESFLLLRFGDHQPGMAWIIDPSASEDTVARRIMSYDPRYFTTYYALDAVNFQPKDLSSALDRLEAPYLPLVLQEAAGLPLDPSFVEQKKILARCQGMFFSCAGGAEMRRFNRLMIDAGLIRGLMSR